MSPDRRPRVLLRAVTGAAALVAALAAAPASQAAVDQAGCSPGLGLGLADGRADKDPRAAVYIVEHVKPGATLHRRLQVCNGTDAPLNVKLYGGDATIHGGAFSVTEGRSRGEVATWTTVNPAALTVPAHTHVLVTATIAVPSKASAGERYGVVLAELPAEGRAGGVNVASRVGVRIYLNVGQGGDPRSDFVVDSLQGVRRADGTPAVLARVRNTGQRALDMRGTLQLSDGPGGLSAGPFPAQVGTTLAPGDSAPIVVPLDKAIRGGPWHGVIDMKSGLVERKAEGQLTFPDQAAAASPAVKAHALPLYQEKGVVIPFAGGLIGLLSLALLVLGLREYLRRQNQRVTH